MSQSVSNAVAQRESGPSAVIAQYGADFAMVLPTQLRSEVFIRLAVGVMRRDKTLREISEKNPGSLMQALLECARLGHEPGTKDFYLVPIGGNVEGWESYRGVIERMYRSDRVSAVKAELVYSGDTFRYDPTSSDPVTHDADWFGDRGTIVGAYAYADLKDGSRSKVVLINRPYIDKVRAESKGSKSSTSPWVKWEAAMVLKTVIHRLEPFVPTSTEDRRLTQPAAVPGVPAVSPPSPELPVLDAEDIPDAEIIDPDIDPATGEVVQYPDEDA